MSQEIIFNFPRDHTKGVTVSVNGVKGESCVKLTEGIEKALGGVTKREETGEFYEAPLEQQQHLKQGF